MTDLTLPLVTEALPKHLRASASQELVDKLNQISTDPEAARMIRENFIGYTKVLNEGRFKVEDYLNAVSYVSFKLMGYNNKEAYVRAFPDRYQGLVMRGATDKDISAYVAAYSKGKLVTSILEQTIIPAWVLHQDAFMQAIETQVELMTTAKSEKVRSDAANSILTHLKKPEKTQHEIAITTPLSSGLDDLSAQLTQLAEMQREMIAGGGMTTRDVAHQTLVRPDEVEDAEVVEEDPAPAQAPAVAGQGAAAERKALNIPEIDEVSAPRAPTAPLGPIFGGPR